MHELCCTGRSLTVRLLHFGQCRFGQMFDFDTSEFPDEDILLYICNIMLALAYRSSVAYD